MKKKRILLHALILMMATVSMGIVIFGIYKNENYRQTLTKEDYCEQYRQRYVTDMNSILQAVESEVEKGVSIKNMDLTFGGLDLGFKVTSQKKDGTKESYVYHWEDKENSALKNRSRLDEKGFTFPVEKSTVDDFLLSLDDAYITEYYLFGDYNGTESLYEKELNFLKKYNLVFDFGVNKFEYGNLTNIEKRMDNAPTYAQNEKMRKDMLICFVISGFIVILSAIPFVWLLVIAGRCEKKDKSYHNAFDKLWLEAIVILGINVYSIILFWGEDIFCNQLGISMRKMIIPWAIYNIFAVEGVLQISESVARRLKTKTLIRSTFVGYVYRKVKGVVKLLWENINTTAKVLIFGSGTFVILFFDYIWAEYNEGLFSLSLRIALPVIALCIVLWNYLKEKETIIEETTKIAEGQLDNKIQNQMKFHSNRTLSEEINKIGESMSIAVAASVKNERMKTELITNVSHDIKTPLTSIINYVDLLKTDGLDSGKAQEYLEILDRKSQRLKTLTEDLVEASKLNSGVIELNIESIDIVQLVNQSLAEYSERFEQNDLHIIKNISRDTIIVKADGRKTWRALDNLYSNVCKYAMPGTRVYIDITEENQKAVVAIKNISQGALNFSADELMERFVRGDVSRSTEGSGLGLSIAKTIMERQDGELRIILDGDLFKVEIRLKK